MATLLLAFLAGCSSAPSIPGSVDFERMVRGLRADWPRLLPGAAVRNVDGAGHYVHQDRPKVVAEKLVAMVEAVTRLGQSSGSR